MSTAPVRHFLILSLLICCALSANAQRKIVNQRQAWYGYYNHTDFSPKIFLFTELENRQFMAPAAENLLMLRTHLHYKVQKHWDVAAGFGYVVSNSSDPYKPSKLWVPELRPFIEANGNYAFGKFSLSGRLRAEERFIGNTEAGELADGFAPHTRFRYRYGMDYVIFQSKTEHKLKLRFSDEVLWNIPTKKIKNIFDQNRAYLGISYSPPIPLSFEVGYLHYFQQRSTLTDFYSRNVFRFQLTHRISFQPKKGK